MEGGWEGGREGGRVGGRVEVKEGGRLEGSVGEMEVGSECGKEGGRGGAKDGKERTEGRDGGKEVRERDGREGGIEVVKRICIIPPSPPPVRFGDQRVTTGKQVILLWHKLSTHKGQFIPDLISSFLKISLLRQHDLRRFAIPLVFDVIKCEQEVNGNFKRVETEVFDKVDELVFSGQGDEEYKEMFSEMWVIFLVVLHCVTLCCIPHTYCVVLFSCVTVVCSYTALHCVTLHYTVSYYLLLHCITLCCIASHTVSYYCIALCYIRQCCSITLHCVALQYTVLYYYTAFSPVVLRCAALHCISTITLHCTVLHSVVLDRYTALAM